MRGGKRRAMGRQGRRRDEELMSPSLPFSPFPSSLLPLHPRDRPPRASFARCSPRHRGGAASRQQGKRANWFGVPPVQSFPCPSVLAEREFRSLLSVTLAFFVCFKLTTLPPHAHSRRERRKADNDEEEG